MGWVKQSPGDAGPVQGRHYWIWKESEAVMSRAQYDYVRDVWTLEGDTLPCSAPDMWYNDGWPEPPQRASGLRTVPWPGDCKHEEWRSQTGTSTQEYCARCGIVRVRANHR